MAPQLNADASRFCRGRANHRQSTQDHEAGGWLETTAHGALLHDFVLVPLVSPSRRPVRPTRQSRAVDISDFWGSNRGQ
jgi:hypothetical protein